MSTDRKRLTKAIQRIAREDPEIRALLEDYRNSGGKPSESATSGSGAGDRQICCDGETSKNNNPGSGTRDPGDGGQDGVIEDDPANLDDMGPGSLDGVTDCATGEPICFEGSDWIPPEGWDSPTEPAVDPTYEEGKYWAIAGGGNYGHFSATKGGSLGSFAGANDHEECEESSSGSIRCGITVYPLLSLTKAPCEEVHEDETYCNPSRDDLITETEWPSDGCVNLAVKGGKLVGSKFDPENDGSWSKPRDSVELCDEYGNSFELKPSASGGWKSISSQNPGDGYLYDSSGQQIARISESEYSDPNV